MKTRWRWISLILILTSCLNACSLNRVSFYAPQIQFLSSLIFNRDSVPEDAAWSLYWLGEERAVHAVNVSGHILFANESGDFIKNQSASAEYYDDFGWFGDMEDMTPHKGYMLRVAEASTLLYPNFGAGDALTRTQAESELPTAIAPDSCAAWNRFMICQLDSRGLKTGIPKPPIL